MATYWDTVADIDFRSGNGRYYLMEGWDGREWTLGHRFSITIGPIPIRQRLAIRLEAAPFLEQAFTVSCNGGDAGEHRATAPFRTVFLIPDDACRALDNLEITIVLNEPKRPCDHSGSADRRPLGLSLRRIEILGTNGHVIENWPELPVAASVETAEAKSVLADFESLGDNCELGFVQKRAGSTSSALLRFCATPVDCLIEGLAHGFSGIDDPETLDVVVSDPRDGGEYQVISKRYGLHYHTLTYTHELDRDVFLERELAKLRHKHAKFVRGLAGRDRIYVVKHNDGLQPATVRSIWLELQRHGPNALMHVRAAVPGEPGGRVRVLGPGLLEATIDRFAEYADATLGADEAWVAICREAVHVIATERRRLRGDDEAVSSVTDPA